MAPNTTGDTVHGDMVAKPNNAPDGPGVYEFSDEHGSPLYVGKALNLKKRLATYFAGGVSARTRAMLDAATKVSWTLCVSEQEALLLEREKIKKLQPPYNIKLREGTGYSGLAVSKERTPKLFPWRGRRPEQAHVFGPYPQTGTRALVDALITVYKIRSCTEHVFTNAVKTQKACLLYETNQCLAPCLKNTDRATYDKACDDLVKYLGKPDDSLTTGLRSTMARLSEEEKFERAARVRDTIGALESLTTKQVVVREPVDITAWAVSRGFGFLGVCAVDVVKGVVESIRTYESMDNPHSGERELYEYVINNHSPEHAVPGRLNIAPEQTAFTRLPCDGYERDLVSLAKINSQEVIRTMDTSSWLDPAKVYHALQGLGRTVNSARPVQRVECIDISHHAGRNTVGSLVVFDKGGMQPAEYRVAKLGAMQADDYRAMEEMVTKRCSGRRMGLGALPDVLLLDGGKGQVAAGMKALETLGLKGEVAICGLAKQFEEIHLAGSGKPVVLARDNDSLLLLMLIRNAAHNHALGRHRRIKTAQLTERTPLNIPGVGSALEANLYHHFETYEGILTATEEDLARVPSVGPSRARKIRAELDTRRRQGS